MAATLVLAVLLATGGSRAGDRASASLDYVLRGDAIERIEVEQQGDRYRVVLQLDGEETRRLSELTRTNVGRKVRVLFAGETLVEPTIQDEVANGRLPVGYRMTEGEARELERRLRPPARTEHRP
jgi:preprotein translocase subunit SecD